uniref:UDP-N-acetylglucosamine--N-acetylmuramyl-(pentapeptide) pyrophosphoryl-undecaprenol N-acetylglucosamine transferase n=1 Tax=candidate division CPR3 bacterium TaxID=2268181 RepID=A0A7C4M0T0_UNCC3
MDKTKIVICGGHFTPALALIEELKKIKNYQVIYIGRKKALEGDRAFSHEFLAIKKLNIPFYSLFCGRLQRSFTIYTIPSLLKFPFSLIHAFILLKKIKPIIVVSFGGYVALPVCIIAWMLGIPVITHEQTHVLGLSNRIICRFAKVTCLSWYETKNLPKNIKKIVTGIPIRKSILSAKEDKIYDFGNKELPLLYITGGSLGSRSINKVIAETLSSLLSKYRIIHQCGSADKQADFYRLLKLKRLLPKPYKENYKVFKTISASKIGGIYNHAKLIIGRSGANTVSEIAYYQKPAIFIPLPWSGEDEQKYNAKELEKIGAAIIIDQKDLTPKKLIQKINLIMKRYSYYQINANMAAERIFPNAVSKIVKIMEEYIP